MIIEAGKDFTAEFLRKRSDSLAPWHQKIEFAPGVFSSDGGHDHDLKPALRLAGACGGSVLDVGCNAGLHSLQAFAVGADRVFSFDARAHWTAQAIFSRNVFGYDDDVWVIQDLDADHCLPRFERFDVVIAKGILYHLANPISFLQEINRIARRGIVINTERARNIGDAPGFAIRRENPNLPVSGTNGVCWYPTGLDVLRIFFTQSSPWNLESAQWLELHSWETETRCQIVLKRKPKQ